MAYQNLVKHTLDSLELIGYSVAGEETVIAVPPLNICFDIGRAPEPALSMDNILLSHGHMDHAAGITYYFAQRDFQDIPCGTALVPAPLVGPLEQLMSAWGRVEGHVPPHNFVGMKPGDDFEIHRNLIVRAFGTRHIRGSLGFCIIDVRLKLKQEYLGLTGPQIVELKKKGVEITNRVEVPLVAYLGDTAAANYSDLACVAGAKALLIECTFFDDEHMDRARAGKHLHVRDLPGVLEGMQNEKVILVHVTRRTNLGVARKILRKTLNKDLLERTTFLMSRRHVEDD